jgi:predicted Zn-dependent peptidase
VWDLLRRQVFADSPLGNDALGTPESVKSITRDHLVAYWEERYTANNTVVSVAGNFHLDATVAQIDRIVSSWSQGVGRSFVHEPLPQKGTTVVHKDAAQENLGFAFPAVSASDPHYYTTALMSMALGGGSNSRLYREVREKRGLAYAVQARFDGFEKSGLVRIYVGTSAERAHESVHVVLDEIDRLESDGITDDELRRSKTRLKSQLIMRSESTRARMGSNLRSWWYENRLYSLDDIRERIDAVTLDEVRALAGSLGMRQHLSAAAIGPRPEEELFGDVLATA